MKKQTTAFYGFLIGLLNGLFGAGGGIVAVKALEKEGLTDKSAHATGGIAGAVFGGWLLPKIPDFWLRKIFSLFILYAAVRLFFR